MMRYEQWHEGALAATAEPTALRRPSERDICESYLYLLGRLLVLRQEHFDLIGGMKWNQLVHRSVGASHPSNLDVACSEAWVAVDETSCTMLEVPRITGRYYTVHVLNLWGETVTNINERTFPDHPFGTYVFCLKGTNITLPAGTRRIDLPGRKARVFVRIELGTDPKQAIALQERFTMRAVGRPVVPAAIGIPLFPNEKLPGVEAFDSAMAILASELDPHPAMDIVQSKVRTIAALIRNEDERRRVDDVIRQRSWALKHALFITNKDWVTQRSAGSYESDWLARTAANLFGMWSNNKAEVVAFKAGTGTPLVGDFTYVMKFDRDNLPAARVRYFWSVTCVDSHTLRVVPNVQNRFLITSRSQLHHGDDGSLTLYFAPRLPEGAPASNWLATPTARNYLLTWRAYGPDPTIVSGQWFPPPLLRLSAPAAE